MAFQKPNPKFQAKVHKKASVLPWFKNVAKSLGYSSADLVDDMAPAISQFVKDNKDTAAEIFGEIRNARATFKRLYTQATQTEQFKILQEARKNAIADLKSGNLYNVKRLDDQQAAEWGDFENFEVSPGGSSDSDATADSDDGGKPQPTVHQHMHNTILDSSPIVGAINTQTKAMVVTSEATTKATTNMMVQQMTFNKKFGDSMINGLTSINNNLSALVDFQSTSMVKYIGASLKYYEDSLKSYTEQLGELKKLTENIAKKEAVQDKPVNQAEEAMFYTGGLNMKGYMNVIKKNVKSYAESDPLLSMAMMTARDTSGLKQLATNPLMFLSTKLASLFIPATLKIATESLDKTFSNFFPALFMKLDRAGKNNPILEVLSSIFGLKVETKSAPDLSLMKRGQVPFDSDTKTAIVDVIPGYLRKILAVLSDGEEIAFDMSARKFKTVSAMAKEYKQQRDYAIQSNYGDSRRAITNVAKSVNMDPKLRGELMGEVNKWFTALGKSGKNIDPNNADEIKSIYQFSDSTLQKFFIDAMKKMPKSNKMSLFGKEHYKNKAEMNKWYKKIEDDPTLYNYAILQMLGFDEHLEDKEANFGAIKTKKGFGAFNRADEMGKTSIDYLRDIATVLHQGIRVFPQQGQKKGKGGSGGGSGGPGGANWDKWLSDQSDAGAEYKRKEEERKPTSKTAEEHAAALQAATVKGIGYASGSRDLANMSEGQMAENLYRMENEDNKAKMGKSSIAKWLGKFMTGSAQEKYNQMREAVDKFLQTPVNLLKGVFERVDNTLYEVIFGKQDGDSGQSSIIGKMWEGVQSGFDKFQLWATDNFFKPIKESLIGKDGIITQFKDSAMWKNMISKGKDALKFLFGSYDQSANKLTGGLFGDVGNEFMDIGKSLKHYFTGKEYTNSKGEKIAANEEKSVFGEIGKVAKEFGSNMKEYIFGKPDDPDKEKQKGVLGGIGSSLSKGFSNFYNLIFGHEKMSDFKGESFKEYMGTIKKRAPKSIAWGIIGSGAGAIFGGKLGLLGSLFLPGGPIGGLILGSALGFLSQSDKVKDWLFGKEVDGKRVGGMIGVKTQEFFKKHKAGIIGGATLGALKTLIGVGFVANPILGAALGAGVSMAIHSDKFKNFLFGKEDKDGKRVGGILQKLWGKVKGNKSSAETKKMFGNVGAGLLGGAGLGVGVGLLTGVALGPLGIGGAIMGSAAGFLISSKKWKERLFGTMNDETGKREGGLFGKMISWFNLQIFKPMALKFKEIKLNIGEWFEKSIKNPFLDAILPLKLMFKDMVDNMKKMFKQGWTDFKEMIGSVFEKFVGLPFGKFMEERVMKPLKGFLNSIINGVGKVFGAVLSSPIKALTMITKGVVEGKQGEAQANWKSKTKFSKKGLWYAFKANFLDMYDEEDRGKLAVARERAVPGAQKHYKEKEERDKETERKYSILHTKNKRERARLEAEQADARSKGYDVRNKDKGKPSPSAPAPSDSSTPPSPSGASSISSHTTNADGSTSISQHTSRDHEGPQPSSSSHTQSTPTSGYSRSSRDNNNLYGSNTSDISTRPPKPTGPSSSTSPAGGSTSGAPPQGVPSQDSSTGARRGRKMDPAQIASKMGTDIAAIRKAVEGQLNGVGWNLNVIKNILKKKFGSVAMKDEDFTNKKYNTVWGKVKNFIMSPVNWVKDKFMASVDFVKDKIAKFGMMIGNIGKGIVEGFRQIKNGIVFAAKTFIEAGASLIKIPYEIAKAFGVLVKNLGQITVDLVKNIAPVLKETLLSFIKAFAWIPDIIYKTMKGVGVAIFESLKGFGEGLGEILHGLGGLAKTGLDLFAQGLKSTIPALFEFAKETITMGVRFTLDMMTSLFDKLTQVGKGLFEMITSPIKFLGNAVGKFFNWKQEVTVKGGWLDAVAVVEKVGGSGSTIIQQSNTNEPSYVSKILDQNGNPISSTAPTGSSSPILPASSGDSLTQHKGPVPVKIVASDIVLDVLVTNKKKRKGSATVEPIGATGAIVGGLENLLSSNDSETTGKIARKKGSATYLIKKKKEEDEKKFLTDHASKQTDLLSGILKDGLGFTELWASIFGPAGIITGSLIIGLPLLYAAFKGISEKGLSGFLGDIGKTITDGITSAFNSILCKLGFSSFCTEGGTPGKDRKDKDGTYVKDTTTAEDLATTGIHVAGSLVSKAGNAVMKVGQKIQGAVTYAEKTANSVKSVAQRVIGGGKGSATTAAAVSEDAIKTIRNVKSPTSVISATTSASDGAIDMAKVTRDASSMTDDGRKALIDKTLKASDDALKSLEVEAEKLIVQQGSKSSGGLLKNILSKVGKVLTYDTFAKAFPKVLVTAGKAAANTTGVVDVILGVFGLVTGWFEARHLFYLDKETKPDPIMNAISAWMKGLTNVLWFVFIGLIDDLCRTFINFSFLSLIAELMYTAIMKGFDLVTGGKTGETKLTELKTSQATAEQARLAYNKKYGLELSKEAWNDKMHQTVVDKGLEGVRDISGAAYNKAYDVYDWITDKKGQEAKSDADIEAKRKAKFDEMNAARKLKGMKPFSTVQSFYAAEDKWVEDPDAPKPAAAPEVQGVAQTPKPSFTPIAPVTSVDTTWGEKGEMALQGIKSGMYDPVANAYKGAKNKISDTLSSVDDRYRERFNIDPTKSLRGEQLISGMFGDVVGTVTGTGEVGAKATSRLTAGAIAGVENTYDQVRDKFSKGKGVLKSKIKEKLSQGYAITDKVAAKASNLKNTIETGVNDAWTELKGMVDNELKYIKDELTELGKTVKKKIKEFMQTLTNIGNWFSESWEDIKATVTPLWEDFKKGMQEFKKDIVKNINIAIKFFEDIGVWVGDRVDDVKKVVNPIWEEVKNTFKWFGDQAKEKFNDAVKAITDIGTWVVSIKDDLKKAVMDKLGAVGRWILDKADTASATQYQNIAPPVQTPSVFNRITSAIGNIVKPKTADTAFTIVDDMMKKQNKTVEEASAELKSQGYDQVMIDAALKKLNGGNGDGCRTCKTPKGGFGETLNNFAYYSQRDPKWAGSTYQRSPEQYAKYGSADDPTIRARGCGPTSMAMVVSQLTGRDVSPLTMVQKAQQGGYSTVDGTDRSYYADMAKQFGLYVTRMEDDEIQNFPQKLEEGKPVILVGARPKWMDESESPFTTGGHYVVATSLSDGMVNINDPRGAAYSKPYPLDLVMQQTSGAWAFAPKAEVRALNTARTAIKNIGFGNGGFGEKVNNFEYYAQSDPQYSQVPYQRSAAILRKSGSAADPTIGARGCGPTSMAMVASQLVGKEIDPVMMANKAEREGYSVEVGTDWGYYPQMAKELGLNVTPLLSSSEIAQSVNFMAAGNPVILSGKRPKSFPESESPFTTGGHFVVGVAAKNGMIYINDPRGRDYSKPYPIDTVLRQAAAGWAFSRPDGSPAVDLSSFTANYSGMPSTIGPGGPGPAKKAGLFTKFSDIFSGIAKSPIDNLSDNMSGVFSAISDSLFGTSVDSLSSGAPMVPGESNVGKTGTMFTSDNDFINKVAPGALRGYTEGGILPSLTIAQAILESNYGKQSIGNNIFGVKATDDWKGKRRMSGTQEYFNGKMGQYNLEFRDYDSIEDSIADHNKILQLSRYAKVRTARDYKEAARAVAEGGYATAPDYASELIRVMDEHELYKYDKPGGGITPQLGGMGGGDEGIWKMNRTSLNFNDTRYTPDLKNFAKTGGTGTGNLEDLLAQAVLALSQISTNTGDAVGHLGDLSNRGIAVSVNGTTSEQSSGSSSNTSNLIVAPTLANTTNPVLNNKMNSQTAQYIAGYTNAKAIAKGRMY
jgi:hypothetical protein